MPPLYILALGVAIVAYLFRDEKSREKSNVETSNPLDGGNQSGDDVRRQPDSGVESGNRLNTADIQPPKYADSIHKEQPSNGDASATLKE